MSGGQVVLLDHGLVRELRENTRFHFCRIWEALVLQNDDAVQDAGLFCFYYFFFCFD